MSNLFLQIIIFSYIALSCLRFERDGCKCLLALFDGGGGALMAKIGGNRIIVAEESPVVTAASSRDKDKNESKSKDKHKEKEKVIVKVDPQLTALSMMNGILFEGMTIAGWAIKFENAIALENLFQRGVDASLPVDEKGNGCLHIAARCGYTPAIDAVVHSGFFVRLEQMNKLGRTGAMEGAIAGQLRAVRHLCQCGADPRRGLDGRYWGWLLAIARKKESKEMNLQTGVFGADDEQYFPTAPDPSYLVWYNTSS